MATKRDLKRAVREVTHPAKMLLREALAIPDPTAALHSFVSNVSEATQVGADLARDYYALCVLNSGGAPALFLTEWLFERLADIRVTLVKIGAHRTVRVLDEISARVDAVATARENPDLVILSDEFQRCATSLPRAQELADEVRGCLLAHLKENVGQFENAEPEPHLVRALETAAAEVQELAARAGAWTRAAEEADVREFEQLIVRMVGRGQRVDAIRAWRRRFNCPLLEAKSAVVRLAGGPHESVSEQTETRMKPNDPTESVEPAPKRRH